MHSAQQPFTASAGAHANGTSARKAEANRANAQKSTGPASEAGKARSSQNAARHSMLSSTSTLLANPDQELDALVVNYRTDFAPAGAHEDFLVTELAVCDWRVKHITRIEAGVMANMMQASYIKTVIAEQVEPGEPPIDLPELAETTPDTQTTMMGAGWLNNPNAFALLLRYQTQARRDYYKALKQLEQVRSGKASYLPDHKASVDETNPSADPPTVSTQAQPPSPSPSTEKNGTNPPDTGYVLDWEVPEFFVYDPTFLDRFSQPVNKTKKDDDIDPTRAHRPR